jgi:hypothetical protein
MGRRSISKCPNYILIASVAFFLGRFLRLPDSGSRRAFSTRTATSQQPGT